MELWKFEGNHVDMDVWRKSAAKANGEKYYEYIFVYTNDIIAVSEKLCGILDALGRHYFAKNWIQLQS